MRRLLVLAFVLSASVASSEPLRASPSWLRLYLPIRPQLVPSGGGSFAGGAVTGATSFLDGTNFSIKNTADPTKVGQFDLSNISTATTRTVIWPNVANGTMALVGSVNNAGNFYVNDDLQIGKFSDAVWIAKNTAQTPDTSILAVGATGGSILIVEIADIAFDFAHALPAVPTLFIQSAAQNTTDFMGLSVNGFGMWRTITTGGTTGAQTINKPAGTVNFAAAATTLVVTDSLVNTSSIVYAVLRTNDATCRLATVVPAAGSFTIAMTAACTAETSVGFLVTN